MQVPLARPLQQQRDVTGATADLAAPAHKQLRLQTADAKSWCEREQWKWEPPEQTAVYEPHEQQECWNDDPSKLPDVLTTTEAAYGTGHPLTRQAELALEQVAHMQQQIEREDASDLLPDCRALVDLADRHLIRAQDTRHAGQELDPKAWAWQMSQATSALVDGAEAGLVGALGVLRVARSMLRVASKRGKAGRELLGGEVDAGCQAAATHRLGSHHEQGYGKLDEEVQKNQSRHQLCVLSNVSRPRTAEGPGNGTVLAADAVGLTWMMRTK